MANRLKANGEAGREQQPGPGHNSAETGKQLAGFVSRIERLNEEKAALQADISAVFAQAKSAGFDASVMREIIKERKMDTAERIERETLRDIYRHALGMLADTPLGEAALDRAGTGAPV